MLDLLYIKELILERNPLHVISVGKLSLIVLNLLDIRQLIQKRNPMDVTSRVYPFLLASLSPSLFPFLPLAPHSLVPSFHSSRITCIGKKKHENSVCGKRAFR